MGGVVRNYSIVFGYEQEDGSIVSVITNDMVFDNLYSLIKTRKLPAHRIDHKRYTCFINFFGDEYFQKDESKWRILYKFDNTTVIRNIDDKNGEIIYKGI